MHKTPADSTETWVRTTVVPLSAHPPFVGSRHPNAPPLGTQLQSTGTATGPLPFYQETSVKTSRCQGIQWGLIHPTSEFMTNSRDQRQGLTLRVRAPALANNREKEHADSNPVKGLILPEDSARLLTRTKCATTPDLPPRVRDIPHPFGQAH